jgi:adenylate kinase family enzyme
MPKETQYSRDLKKAVGSPKIIFVLGGPGTGRGTQCAKLVEEFGYEHISTGDVLRKEMAKDTKEGADIKKIVGEGGLVSN